MHFDWGAGMAHWGGYETVGVWQCGWVFGTLGFFPALTMPDTHLMPYSFTKVFPTVTPFCIV
jgi:hypothetical protein